MEKEKEKTIYEGLQKENISFWGQKGGIIRCLKKELLERKKHRELICKTIYLCIMDNKTTNTLENNDAFVATITKMLRKLN